MSTSVLDPHSNTRSITQMMQMNWNVHCQTKAHSEKDMNVSDVKVADEDGYLSRSKSIKANNKIVKKPLGYTSEDAIDVRLAVD